MNSFDLDDARQRYLKCCRQSLHWMLEREPLHGVWLNTKQNSVSLQDFTDADGAAGPDYIYGWIQGRGLEAVTRFATYFEKVDADLASLLDQCGKRLYKALADLQSKDGHVYFCHDADMVPVSFATGSPQQQETSPDIWTYSDAFAAKGLVCAAARYDHEDLPKHLSYLQTVVESIRTKRFSMNEKLPLNTRELANQPDDYGPRMILLGACGLLESINYAEKADYTMEFVLDILAHHHDQKSNLLRNVPSEKSVNAGHAIEFVGFALACIPLRSDSELCKRLATILISSFRAAFIGPGVALSISADDKSVLDSRCPWWSLPETISAAAQLYYLDEQDEALQIWQSADEAFFTSYWRADSAVAYQNRSGDKPVTDVPATPDLDPCYHTCLSLLHAIKAIESATHLDQN